MMEEADAAGRLPTLPAVRHALHACRVDANPALAKLCTAAAARDEDVKQRCEAMKRRLLGAGLQVRCSKPVSRGAF